MASIQYVVDRIVFKNEAKNFAILRGRLQADPSTSNDHPIDPGKPFSARGTFTNIEPRDLLELHGEWVEDSRYGWQFNCAAALRIVPQSIAGYVALLERLPHVGPKRAAEIVALCGNDCARVLHCLEHEPHQLEVIAGLTHARIERIQEAFLRETRLRDALVWLYSVDIPEAWRAQAVRLFGATAHKKLQENPYLFADLPGVSFTAVDAHVRRIFRIDAEDPRREQAATKAALEQLASDGHSWASDGVLRYTLQRRQVETRLRESAAVNRVQKPEAGWALSTIHSAETRLARLIRDRLSSEVDVLEIPEDLWAEVTPDVLQVEAVERAASCGLLIQTGGPGCGKTTTLKRIVQMYRTNGLCCLLMAPTGKAAMRLSEVVGHPATTIHRGLGVDPDGGWLHHQANPLSADVVVVDEASMLSIELAEALFAAIPPQARVLLAGDAGQLPSIEAGRVLADLIESGTVPVVELTRVFRQATESQIPYVARDFTTGKASPRLRIPGSDARLVVEHDPETIRQMILQAVLHWIPQQRGIEPEHIQVLSPQNTGPIGVEQLNRDLQAALCPARDAPSVNLGGNYTGHAGCRVLHIRNNYDLGVMNGEMGIIQAVDPENETLQVVIDTDKRVVEYTYAQARELHLGYTITVHKSQGSQFPAVVIPVHSCQQYMLTRHLLYTGLTRAERYALFVGTEQAIAAAANNDRDARRYTRLKSLLT